jgi:hypothetical protein
MTEEERAEQLLQSFVEVRLKEQSDFLKVVETLTRIGVASPNRNTLYQTCHILHKRGKYYILHFKEFFLLDGKQSSFTEEDKVRRNTIAVLLANWGLVEIIDKSKVTLPKTDKNTVDPNALKIIPFKEKKDWELVCKYHAGRRKSKTSEFSKPRE